MTLEQIEAELKHLATKEDIAQLEVRFERAMKLQFYWMVGLISPIYILIVGLILALIPHLK
jgi:hypothetical protein